MPVMTISELFAEANGLTSTRLIPSGLNDMLALLSKFCDNHSFTWGLEKGQGFNYCVYIICPTYRGWVIEMESDTIQDAILMAVVEVCQRLTRPSNVVYPDEWKNRT